MSEDQYDEARCRNSDPSSTLFGGNAPFIEEQYERYLADPAAVSADWRAYFDSLRGGRADVAHATGHRVVHRASRKHRKVAGAMVDASTMHKQVLVLRLISKFRTLGMFHADLDPLKRQEKPLPRGPRPRDLRIHRTPISTPSSTSARSRRARSGCGLRDLIAALKETYCRTLGAEYMYIIGHGDQALHPGAAGADPLAAHVRCRAAAAHPRAADRGGNAGALPAHEVRRAEALLRRGRAHDDPDARPPDPARRRSGRAARR